MVVREKLSHHPLASMAGNGSAEFVKEGERLQPKVSHCFNQIN